MSISSPEIWWVLIFGTSGLLLLAGILVVSITFSQRRYIAAQRQKMELMEKGEQQLRASHDQLRKLSEHLQSAREEERTRIAREIHDQLGQLLTVLKMDISLLQQKLRASDFNGKGEEVGAELESMKGLVDNTIQSVRKIATELRPEILDELGIENAIEAEMQLFESRTGIKSIFHSNLDELNLDQDRATAVYRIFQESLTNVARHAVATEVTATFDRRGNDILLHVRDNGKGISAEELQGLKSLGLLGMRERAMFIGGDIAIVGKAGEGTTVTLRFPIEVMPASYPHAVAPRFGTQA